MKKRGVIVALATAMAAVVAIMSLMALPVAADESDPEDTLPELDDIIFFETEYDVPDGTVPEDILGDVNMDGKLNIRDASLVRKALVSIVTPDDEMLLRGDFNMDKKLNIKDVTAIQIKIAE